eukprot:gene1755-524_t
MKNGYLEKTELEELLSSFKRTNNVETTDRSIDEYIGTINESLSDFHFRIQVLVHPKTNKTFFGMINQVDDDISQLATNFTSNELLFFKAILAEIVQADEESKTFLEVDAINERGKIGAEEAENTLNRFIKENWLSVENHVLWYGIRTLLDLRMYIDNEFGIDVHHN